MSNIASLVAGIHRPLDKTPFRVLSLTLALLHAGLVLWEPNQYAAAIGGFNEIIGPLMIWAACSGVIAGVGFTPIHWVWRLVFSPWISLSILFYLSVIYLIG